ncbi:hypothetical protein BX286_4270 [Streptomyces sp. 3211.6]|uniref:hypothetical protein n=1 Tax=unclassified Streptomyces TaxID=2593676 RepID=UPI000CBD537D|nr:MULTISPECIES: hypothetical protein [unclassified Streptomyces]RKT06232.1 hypothetical protein BX286_4270 [Streptomyces sp. 3211.6]RPF46231.1 hypothetical protein EDD96_2802 [Streptomyces sp. Ag109_G2-6]
MTTEPHQPAPNPYSGAPVPPNPYAGAAAQQPNPYAQQPAGQPPMGQPGQPPVGQPPHPGAGYPPPPGPGLPAQQGGPGAMPYDPAYAPPYGHAPAPGCRNCGAPQAALFSVRAHVGVLVLMRFHTLNGPFCRPCGRSLVRTLTTKTLCQGWWSPLSLVIFTPFTLIWNLLAAIKFGKLPDPTPAPGRQPLEEGPPVYARPLAYVAIVPLLWFTWVIANIYLDVSGRR